MSFLHYWKQASDPNISSIETHGTRQGNWRFHSDSDSTYIEKNRLNGTYIASPSRDGLWPPPPPPPPLPHPFLFEFEEQTLPPTPPDFWLSWAVYFWDNTLPTRVCTKFSRCDLGISFSDIWMTTWTLLFGFMCMFFVFLFFLWPVQPDKMSLIKMSCTLCCSHDIVSLTDCHWLLYCHLSTHAAILLWLQLDKILLIAGYIHVNSCKYVLFFLFRWPGYLDKMLLVIVYESHGIMQSNPKYVLLCFQVALWTW